MYDFLRKLTTMRLLSKKHHRAIDHACSIVYLRSMLCGRNCGIGMMQYNMLSVVK